MLNTSASIPHSSHLIGIKYARSMLKPKYDSLYHKKSVLSDLRQDAQNLSKEYPFSGLKTFFEHWGDHIYDHGMKITDPAELHKFTSSISDDINNLHDQVANFPHKEVIHVNNCAQKHVY